MIHSWVGVFEGKYKLIMQKNTASQAGAPCWCAEIYIYIYIFKITIYFLIVFSIIFLHK